MAIKTECVCVCVCVLCDVAMTNMSSSSSDISPTHRSGCCTPSSPRSERERRQRKIRASIQHLEQHREKILHDSKLVGKTTGSTVAAVNYHMNLRRVNFKWQRGIKIGNSLPMTVRRIDWMLQQVLSVF